MMVSGVGNALSALRQDSAVALNESMSQIMRRVYEWGMRVAGLALAIGLLLHLAAGEPIGFETRAVGLPSAWLNGSLIVLWIVPTLSLLISGIVWLRRRVRDLVGWLALATVGFLLSLWLVA